ncbi:MAG: hypothetical protein AAF349_13495 [Cyanobacteria bacterium P01_A01_bin.68]|uniref:Uncharacterized protein n=1 Tax=Calothrix parasitica NIES-267 TaxID=1973488 RepID=A0A1Z4LWA7_9CYAN|nr:hypothetical protein NIES267_48780 [Calothrix parasitica NIES-267]
MNKFDDIEIEIDVKEIDFDSLESDEDFRSEAQRLLPKALVQVGEAMAEKTWEDLQKEMQKSGIKSGASQSAKRKFIQETKRTYQRNASSRDKRELEDYLVEKLHQYK